MLDALAYGKAARAAGVPAVVEISQSGRGAHAWVFFAGAVTAAVARALGTVLVHEAMVLRGSMDLRSYDRLFPNQDVLPDGGFGNLIAAPLQGKRRKNGLTAFLDLATLEPYEDQWAFLSTLDRLSPGEVEKLARRAKSAVVGTDVAALSSSAATRVNPPLPAIVPAELGAGLTLSTAQLTPAALATFKHAASIANPKFYELQRLRKSTWDTPRFVRGYDVTVDDRLVLPRGLRHTVAAIVERAGSRLSVTDVRNPGLEVDLSCTAELNSRQSAAVSAILAHDDVVAALGRGRNCLVLTRRIAHLDLLAARLAERGHPALVLQGGMSVADRRATVSRVADAKAGDGVLVVGTTPFIGEGFDAPALDTLFLAGPISFDGLLVQCAGRVVRAAHGKDVAEVHDYHDRAVPIVAASLSRRMPGYRALGFVPV